MNLGFKIISILIGSVIIFAIIGYLVFKMPVSPVELPSPDLPSVPSGTEPPLSEQDKKTEAIGAQQTGGAYARLLGESDFDNSIFSAEIIDANLLTGEKAEFVNVGNVYGEIIFPPVADFCSKIADLAEESIAKIESRGSVVLSRKIQIGAQITNGRIIRDEQKNSIRLQNSASRDRYVERLSASSAQNSAHKAAVEKFIASITDVVNNRRTAVNAAQQLFRQELDEARLAREGLVSTSIARFKVAANSAFERAKSNCVSGAAPAVVRAELQMALKAVHDKFIDDQSAAEKLSTALQSAISARKSAVAKALADFKLAMESARKTFKASFPKGE